MGDKRNSYKVLLKSQEEKIHLNDLGVDGKILD
jgi:hypothetical protein